MITKEIVVDKLSDYLKHKVSLEELVEWAEMNMMEGEIDIHHNEEIRNVLARLGLADVRAFGLTWEDCEQLLSNLGYFAQIEIVSE